MNRTILFLDRNDTDERVAKLLGLVGPTTAGDADAEVAADGADIETENGTYGTKRTENTAAKLAAKKAVGEKNSQKKKGIAAYNKAAKKVMEKYPDDVEKWASLGYPVSKIATDKKPCKKIIGGNVKQWIHDGFVVVSWKSLGTDADFYTLEECQGDQTMEANWVAANPAQCKEAEVIVKPKKLNVPTWYRVTGHNTAGEGVAPSNPFGGKPIY